MNQERDAAILALVDQGLFYHEIAARFGVTPQRIRQIIKRLRPDWSRRSLLVVRPAPCKRCGAPLPKGRHYYCSDDCRPSTGGRSEKTCAVCRVVFLTTYRKQQHCSHRCALRASALRAAITSVGIPTDAATEEEAMWRDALADIPPAFVAQTLSTDVLRRELARRGYHVEPPAGWPKLIDEEL